MKPRINSEFTRLKKVMVHTPGEEHQHMIPWVGDHPMMGYYPRAWRELQANHGDLTKFLVQEIGKENVLELSDLLVQVFESASLKERLDILRDTLHNTTDEYLASLESNGTPFEKYPIESLARDLITGYPRELTVSNGHLPRIIIPPKREMMWMRDSAAVTPAGVIINNMASQRRKPEPTLVRTVFKYHPMFDRDSIFMDMVDLRRSIESDTTSAGLPFHYLMEGGNILILSEDTLAIGVGRHEFHYSNRTTPAAFELFVKKIFEADPEKKIRRIYMVNVPDLRGFIHLDTVFNMMGPGTAIVMPYIFGLPEPGVEPHARQLLQHFVGWLRKSMEADRTDLSKIPTVDYFDYAGKCEVYDRKYIDQKGEVMRLPQPANYFLDQLITDGLLDPNRITWIGGDMEDYVSPYEHLKVALFEQHNMAGNVFTVAPWRVVTYHRNPLTADALEKNLKVLSPDAHLERMTSNEIRTDNGGPHCLTMPLLREDS